MQPPTPRRREKTEMTARNEVEEAAHGFRVSDQPVVEPNRPVEQPSAETSAGLGELPSTYGRDLLYVIARDPKSLFLYWDLDWTKLFAQAGVSARQVHVRVFREDGSAEATMEIDPFASYCHAEVAAPGARYYCELGCFDENEWKSLIRSATTATPEAEMSEEIAADFATLPFHLSFQRLLETLGVAEADRKTLAASAAQLQEKARRLRDSMPPEDWARVSALLEMAETSPAPPAPSLELLQQLKRLGERYGGSGWGGPSSNAFGPSSRA